MRNEEANRQKDKLIYDSLNLVNASLVEFSAVNKDRFKNNNKQSIKRNFAQKKGHYMATSEKIEKKKLTCYVCGK